jgi:hypothetical protein
MLVAMSVALAGAVSTILLLIWWLRREILHRRQLEKLVEWRSRADEQERVRRAEATRAREEGRGWSQASVSAAKMLERAVARAEAAFGGGRWQGDRQNLMEMEELGEDHVADVGEELERREGAVGFQNLLAAEEREEAEEQQRSLRQRSRSRNREVEGEQQQQHPQ